MTLAPIGLGFVLAILTIIIALLIAISVVPATPVTVGACLVALGVARLC